MAVRLATLLCILSAALSVYLTKHFFPDIKEVQVTKEVVRTDVQTVVHTVTKPDGTTDTTTTTVDHTIKTETENKQTSIVLQPKWNVSGLVATDLSKHGLTPIYGISVSKEILGPITVGLFGLTNSTLGLSIGINF